MANNLDFTRLAGQLVPPLLRKPRTLNWLGALLAPLRQLYATFLLYIDAARRELSYNSQRLVFEKALNDQFDPYGKRIWVQNADTQLTPLYLNLRIENQQLEKRLYFVTEGKPWRYLYGQVEFSTQIDFTVRVPTVLQTAERTTQLHARIKRFKLATRRYSLLFSDTLPPLNH